VSSRLLRKERPDLEVRYWKGTLWSPSYCAGSGGGAHRNHPAIHRATADATL